MSDTLMHLDRLFVTEMPEGLDHWLYTICRKPGAQVALAFHDAQAGFPGVDTHHAHYACLYRVVTRKARSV